MTVLKLFALWALALGMIAIGVLHFVQPKPFVRIVPKYLPAPLALVYISGFFEIAGGVGLLVPATRVAAAWGLIALYIAVFPANIYMLTHNISLNPKKPIPRWALWARLPVQFVLMAWAYWFTTG
ncbi:MAG: DoxX family protein [Myxococcales bacterium]|nr:DoxX family protein [Myxococcales bacterium]MDH3486197.1 DoxX family protein [Myxococcales bacterium]